MNNDRQNTVEKTIRTQWRRLSEHCGGDYQNTVEETIRTQWRRLSANIREAYKSEHQDVNGDIDRDKLIDRTIG